MRIDVHTHIWNDQADRVAEFVKGMDRHNVDKACVLPIAPFNTNEHIAACVKQAPDRLIGFASVLPFGETTGVKGHNPIDDLERAVVDLGLRGLKLHPMIQAFSLDDPGLAPLMAKAAELEIPVLFHTGPSHGRAGRIKNAMIEHMDDLAMMCPNTTIIAGHADIFRTGPYIAAKHPNVYLETALHWERFCRLIPGLGEEAIKSAGAKKVMFGTDFNVDRPERLEAMVAALDRLELSQETRDAVYGGNAARILKLA